MVEKVQVEVKSAIIKGVRKLSACKIEANDLRGGAALVLAGLVAKGTTKIEKIEYIQRGYENLEIKLQKLGANIKLTYDER